MLFRFPAGATTGDAQCLNFTILDDSFAETDEVLDILIADVMNGAIGEVNSTRIVIIDEIGKKFRQR